MITYRTDPEQLREFGCTCSQFRSARTVDVHRAGMMDRLAVRQFAEAIRLHWLGLQEANEAARRRQLPVSSLLRVKMRNARKEQMFSGLPPIADLRRHGAASDRIVPCSRRRYARRDAALALGSGNA